MFFLVVLGVFLCCSYMYFVLCVFFLNVLKMFIHVLIVLNYSLFGSSSVSAEVSEIKESEVQPYLVNLDDNFSNPSVSLNKIYGNDWYAR